MYNKYHICSCKTELGVENVFVYKYFLIECKKDICRGNDRVAIMAYGIEAVCEKHVNDRVVDVCTDKIEIISPYKEKILELIEFLRSHEVSPVHLIDIVGAFADEGVEDFDREADILAQAVMLV